MVSLLGVSGTVCQIELLRAWLLNDDWLFVIRPRRRRKVQANDVECMIPLLLRDIKYLNTICINLIEDTEYNFLHMRLALVLSNHLPTGGHKNVPNP